MELEPNRKLFSDHLSFILHGALVAAGSLWPDFVHKKPSQTFQKLSFEGHSQVQLPPLGTRADVGTV